MNGTTHCFIALASTSGPTLSDPWSRGHLKSTFFKKNPYIYTDHKVIEFQPDETGSFDGAAANNKNTK